MAQVAQCGQEGDSVVRINGGVELIDEPRQQPGNEEWLVGVTEAAHDEPRERVDGQVVVDAGLLNPSHIHQFRF